MSMHILLIEDNEANAQIFLRICHHNGFLNVVHCGTGFEGLFQAQSGTFDIVFVDFDLPDITGLELGLSLAWQMRRQTLPTIILVALTAQSDVVSQEEARRSGFHAFLGKPSTESDVMTILHHFSKRSA